MAILLILLSFALLVAALVGAYMSLDLLPTGPGLLYALSGAAAASTAIVAFALGVVIWRLRELTDLVRQSAPSHSAAAAYEPSPMARPPLEPEAPTQIADAEGGEAPINENRTGRLPTFGESKDALGPPEAPPTLIGRYSAGGANYMIFNDGSIEAETSEGTYKFPSMVEFKRYIADRRAKA